MMDEHLLFEVKTPLGFTVRCTKVYWQRLILKHPPLAERLEAVKQTLIDPLEVRRSKQHDDVFLFYNEDGGRWICAVTRRLNGDGFLITAYPTDAIKLGEVIWTQDDE
jgi:hypothetical protein